MTKLMKLMKLAIRLHKKRCGPFCGYTTPAVYDVTEARRRLKKKGGIAHAAVERLAKEG